MKKLICPLLVLFLLAGGLVAGGCAEVRMAQENDTVTVNYTGKLDDDTVFDSSIGKDPLQFTIGAGQMIPGFEKAVIGMKVGESKTVTIPAEEAYGSYREDLVQEVNRDELPPDMEPEVGRILQGSMMNGQVAIFTVTDVNDTTVTLDANHPLADQDLTFEIELLEIA
ncbi:MAG: peptidylprolyl isomerase [Dehalococcoidia bacterium]|nr:peptidylprolyl isomerase [Dehalococcoidia bacterium]